MLVISIDLSRARMSTTDVQRTNTLGRRVESVELFSVGPAVMLSDSASSPNNLVKMLN